MSNITRDKKFNELNVTLEVFCVKLLQVVYCYETL